MGINKTMKRGCWKSESTFKNFYDQDRISNDSDKLIYESVIIKFNFDKKTLFIKSYLWSFGNMELFMNYTCQ